MNVISIRDLDDEELLSLSDRPIGPSEPGAHEVAHAVRGTIAFLFQQPSLRTMSGYAAAGARLGLVPIVIQTAGNGFRDQTDFEDEVQQLALAAQCVVVRSNDALNPASYTACPAPIINAGDGNNEHPTQTLIDLTVMRHFGLQGRRVAIMGNLRDHRTAHSLTMALDRLGAPVRLISPPELRMEARYVGSAEIRLVESHRQRDEALRDVDFVYMLPTMSLHSPERLLESVYSLNLETAARVLKPTAKILHPFPRFGELAKDLDYTDFDAYHLQTSIGPAVRERVLRHVLGLPLAEPAAAGVPTHAAGGEPLRVN